VCLYPSFYSCNRVGLALTKGEPTKTALAWRHAIARGGRAHAAAAGVRLHLGGPAHNHLRVVGSWLGLGPSCSGVSA
jgi:hypothetical protein